MENIENHQAQQMARLIEKWLDNPISKKILSFCAKRCKKCGRRIDNSLKKYAGEKQKYCLECEASAFIVKKILDVVVKKLKLDKAEINKNLEDYMWRKGLASVLEGLAKYGAKKPFTSYSPFLIVWNITKACNLNCKHCYEDAHKPAPDELNTVGMLKAIDKIGDEGVSYIAVSGGEPLIRPDIFQAFQRMNENEIAFSIATNGTLLTKENVEKLEKLGCRYIQISLDGATAKTHNSFRGTNAFERTIQGIKNAIDSNMCIGIATTVTKHNIREVPVIIDLTEKLGVDIFMHYNFIPTGRGKDIAKLDITPEEREELLKYMANQVGKRKINILSTAPQYGRVCSDFSRISLTHFDTISQDNPNTPIQFLAEFIGGCGSGRLYCALEPNGDIEPCVFIPIKLGNIKTDSLLEVWQNSDVLKKMRDRTLFKGYCSSCKNRNICGGCRARAYGYFNDVTASDPGCIFNKKEWLKIVAK